MPSEMISEIVALLRRHGFGTDQDALNVFMGLGIKIAVKHSLSKEALLAVVASGYDATSLNAAPNTAPIAGVN